MEPAATDEESAESISWRQIVFITEGLSYALRPIKMGAAEVTAEYRLGPRGTAIMALLALGLRYPAELARSLKIGNSLVTVELGHLLRAGLIEAETSSQDRRRSELSLTSLGYAAYDRVKDETARVIRNNLQNYTRKQVELFAVMLRDVSYSENDNALLRNELASQLAKESARMDKN